MKFFKNLNVVVLKMLIKKLGLSDILNLVLHKLIGFLYRNSGNY